MIAGDWQKAFFKGKRNAKKVQDELICTFFNDEERLMAGILGIH